jgi:hypothetical protein
LGKQLKAAVILLRLEGGERCEWFFFLIPEALQGEYAFLHPLLEDLEDLPKSVLLSLIA